jgi:hypothetical protein
MVKNEEGAKTMTAYITGDTYQFRHIFKSSPHYRWDVDRKAWARDYDEPVDDERAISHVRALGGIRNRGEFRVEIE